MRHGDRPGNACPAATHHLGGYGNPAGADIALRSRTSGKVDMARKAKLFTIGYEQTPPKAVLDELENAGVKLLVDVRAVAASRRPGFSKNQLAAGLDERGISYLHLKGLGTPKNGREAARSGKFDLLHKIYAKHLKTPQARQELDELSALVKKSGPVCILCYERDHARCHRQWIAEIIEERDGVKVENLAGQQM
jgi:uncharacterized protein (DUF488 family)